MCASWGAVGGDTLGGIPELCQKSPDARVWLPDDRLFSADGEERSQERGNMQEPLLDNPGWLDNGDDGNTQEGKRGLKMWKNPHREGSIKSSKEKYKPCRNPA